MVGINIIHNSPVAYGLYHVNYLHGMNGWQWMTLYIGLLSFICRVTLLTFLPDSPTEARWATEEEKVLLVERVRENNQGLKNKTFKRDQAVEALKDPMTYLYFALPCVETMVRASFSGLWDDIHRLTDSGRGRHRGVWQPDYQRGLQVRCPYHPARHNSTGGVYCAHTTPPCKYHPQGRV